MLTEESAAMAAFVAAQELLPPEMEKVLRENLWDLYESDAPKVGNGGAAPNESR